jgi:hypothetical protein
MTPMPNLEQLLNRLRQMRLRAITFEWLTHAGWMVALASVAFVLLALVAAIVVPASAIRVIAVGAVLATLVGILVLAIARSTIWSPGPERLALAVEAKYPELKNRLIASLQLADKARTNPEHYSLALVDLTIRQATEMSDAIDFMEALDRRRLRRAARWAGLGFGAALLLTVLFPGLAKKSWDAYSRPLADYAEPIPYTLTVLPGSVEAVKFDDFRITARVEGSDLPKTVAILHRAEGGQWRSLGDIEPVVASKAPGAVSGLTREFQHVLPQVKRDFEYYVVAGDRTSEVYTVTAVDRPRVGALRLEVFPPAYTNLPPLVLDANDGTVTAPMGSRVAMRVESNRDLSEAALVFADGTRHAMTVKGQSATTELVVRDNRTYHLALLDESGRSNPNPIEYTITAIPDREPSVDIVLPGHNVDLGEDMAVNLKIVARDDYGFSGMTLKTRWMSEGLERAVREFAIPESRVAGERLEPAYFFDLADWGLMPEDVVYYYVEVRDNDAVSGPKTAISKTYAVRLPSLDEMMAEFEEERATDMNALDRLLGAERELSKQLETLRRELAPQQELNWDDQKKVTDVAQRAQDLEKELDRLAENMQKQVAEAQEKKLASLEMLQKMMEAQKLFEEVATPEMREAQKRLQEALEKMNPEDIKRAMQEMNFSQDEMIKRLDRTIAYLKRLQAEQKVDAMIRRLEEMAAQEEALNKQSRESPKDAQPNLAPPQERLKERFDEFAEELAAAEAQLNEANLSSPEKTAGFCQSAKNSPASQQMKQAAQSMQSQDKKGAEQKTGEAAESMQQLLAQMKQFQKETNSQQQEQMAKELREALDKTMYLSEEQEKVINETGQLDPTSLSLREMAARQEALRAATEQVAQQLMEMAKQSTSISAETSQKLGQAMECMSQSAQSLSDRRGPNAGNNQKEALFSLNQVSQDLTQSMEKNSQCNNPNPSSCAKPNPNCQNPGEAGQKMGGLSQKQGRLNAQMPQQGQGSGQMSEGERELLRRLKGEQQAIKQGVDELNSEIGKDQQLGRLDKLAEEMQKVIEDMERGQVTEETRERQKRIYTRMLDFQHALQKQDFKDERQAQQPEGTYGRTSPGALPDAAGLTDEEYDRLLTRYQDEGYPKEYEETIKAYFRALAQSRNAGATPEK